MMPPNVYDDFVRASEKLAMERALVAEEGRAVAWRQLAEAQEHIRQCAEENQQLRTRLSAFEALNHKAGVLGAIKSRFGAMGRR